MKIKKFKMLLLTMATIIFSVGAFSANAQRGDGNENVEQNDQTQDVSFQVRLRSKIREKIKNIIEQKKSLQRLIVIKKIAIRKEKEKLNEFKEELNKYNDEYNDEKKTLEYKINYLNEKFEAIENDDKFNEIFNNINKTLKKEVNGKNKLKLKRKLNILREENIFKRAISYIKTEFQEEYENSEKAIKNILNLFIEAKMSISEKERSKIIVKNKKRFEKFKNILNLYSNLEKLKEKIDKSDEDEPEYEKNYSKYLDEAYNLRKAINKFRKNEIKRLNQMLENNLENNEAILNIYKENCLLTESKIEEFKKDIETCEEKIKENEREKSHLKIQFFSSNRT